MKLYGITMRLLGGIGTPLKGDTIFGHFCWQVTYDPGLVKGGIAELVRSYPDQPFVIFSSAFPRIADGYIAIKRPDIPLSFFQIPEQSNRLGRLEESKRLKNKNWLLITDDLSINLDSKNLLDSKDLLMRVNGSEEKDAGRKGHGTENDTWTVRYSQPHNTINRLTQTTGKGMFAPYTQEYMYYRESAELILFVLIDESATDIQRISEALDRIGKTGYGKDASIGKGRFEIKQHREYTIPDAGDKNACYALSPVVPDLEGVSSKYFVPFVRFGKHGDSFSVSRNPFKNPVIMADEGAVFSSTNKGFFAKPYIGKTVTGISKVQPDTIMQGYAIFLPFTLE